jgi:hypothetical protein
LKVWVLNINGVYFHALKNFNKVVKKFIKENDLSEEEIDKIRKEKLELFSL